MPVTPEHNDSFRVLLNRGTAALALFAALPLLAVPAAAQTETAAAATAAQSDEVVVAASRLQAGVAGASATVIDAAEIQASPAQTLPDLLAREAGIQMRELYGAGASRATVDLRGFGATAAQNTLLLVNGRRLNDIDTAAIDWAALPLDSIRRVEVLRGGAGAVLYGDGAVGGTINIVTEHPGALPSGFGVSQSFGSYGWRQTDANVRQSIGAFSANAYGTYIDSDGWRRNNDFTQRSLVGELRHRGLAGETFAKLSANDQELGLPGVRNVNAGTGVNQLKTDPRGADTPFDWAEQNGLAATLGTTRELAPGVDLVLDGGVRRNDQEAFYISNFGPAFDRYVDTVLTTWSLTPRLDLDHRLAGLRANTILGLDFYHADYESDRPNNPFVAPAHRYEGSQQSVAAYGQSTLSLGAATDLSAGLRLQHVRTEATDRFDPTAPGAFGAALAPLDETEQQYAVHLGAEHAFTDAVTLFGRVGRSFRLPTLDDRIGANFVTFDLKTQTSHDAEIGVRLAFGPVRFQSSAYYIRLRNEIQFDPVNFVNRNLAPTRRYGFEQTASWAVTDALRLNGSLAFREAEFDSGPNKGNRVPLVAPWTASAGVTWDALDWLTIAATARYVDAARMDNDNANFQPKIPDYALVDLKLSGEYGMFNWSAAVNNLFDEDYFTYAVASATTLGTYNAYPLPGRTVMVRAGLRF